MNIAKYTYENKLLTMTIDSCNYKMSYTIEDELDYDYYPMIDQMYLDRLKYKCETVLKPENIQIDLDLHTVEIIFFLENNVMNHLNVYSNNDVRRCTYIDIDITDISLRDALKRKMKHIINIWSHVIIKYTNDIPNDLKIVNEA
jgi:hypothetical protein